MKRRDFIKTGMWLVGSTVLPACGGAGGSDGRAEPSPEGQLDDAVLDYPRVLPLPFAHGVASGDPLSDRVIIWTRITESSPSLSAVPVRWEMATDQAFVGKVAEGLQHAVAEHDWTIKVDVTGLEPATTYYYRFHAFGHTSIVGRTRTAPVSAVEEIRLAVVACSSYWSGHFRGYGSIADRNDLDLVLHCGDYIYDFVDKDEEVRARLDRQDIDDVDYRDWLNLDECRRRYALYRSDPHLMRAHQQHPWMIVWDNHDIDPRFGNELDSPIDPSASTCTLEDTTRAFYEWTPTRPVRGDGSGAFMLVEDGSYPQPEDSRLIYRHLSYGPLLDLFGVDTQINLPRYGLEVDASHLPDGAPSLYGRRQFEWFTEKMLTSWQSGVRWRLINNQAWFTPVDIPDLIDGLPPMPKIGLSRWSDHARERERLCAVLAGDNPSGERIRRNIFASGDAHGNLGADVVGTAALLDGYVSGLAVPNGRPGSTPMNALAGFVRVTDGSLFGRSLRTRSVGVEFAPSSMSRGGADEIIMGALGAKADSLTAVGLARVMEGALIALNQPVQFLEWVDHGYGIVSLNHERALFEYWWHNKLDPDATDVLGMQMVTWAEEDHGHAVPRFPDQIDSVAVHGLPIQRTLGRRWSPPAPLDPALIRPR